MVRFGLTVIAARHFGRHLSDMHKAGPTATLASSNRQDFRYARFKTGRALISNGDYLSKRTLNHRPRSVVF